MDGVDSGMNRDRYRSSITHVRIPVPLFVMIYAFTLTGRANTAGLPRVLFALHWAAGFCPFKANTNQKELCLTKIQYSNKYKDYCIEPYTL